MSYCLQTSHEKKRLRVLAEKKMQVYGQHVGRAQPVRQYKTTRKCHHCQRRSCLAFPNVLNTWFWGCFHARRVIFDDPVVVLCPCPCLLCESLSLACLKELLDRLGDRVWRRGRRIALVHLATLVDEELAKVPLDVGAEKLTLILLQPHVERVGIRSVDIDLVKDRVFRPLGFGKLTHFVGRARFLATKLIARERQNLETLRAEPVVQLVEFLVILARESSFRRDVDDEADFVFAVFGEGHLRTLHGD